MRHFIHDSGIWICVYPLPPLPDPHHWTGSWRPWPGGSGAAVHGQPKLAGHPLQLLHRAAHTQHQSLRWLQKAENENLGGKKKKISKTKMDPTVQPHPSPLNFPHVSKIWGWICKASAEHKGVCSCDLGHWLLFFFFLFIKRLKKRLNLLCAKERTPPPTPSGDTGMSRWNWPIGIK